MNDILDDVFFEKLEESNLIKILGTDGRLIMLKLSELCMAKGVGKESQVIIKEIMQATEDRGWLAGIMAVFFCLDMLLQNNPLKARSEDKKEIDSLIKQLEKKLKEKRTNEKKED